MIDSKVLEQPASKWTRAALEGTAVQISVTDAKAKLTELVRRAEADEEIILTRHGQPVVRLVRFYKTKPILSPC